MFNLLCIYIQLLQSYVCVVQILNKPVLNVLFAISHSISYFLACLSFRYALQ